MHDLFKQTMEASNDVGGSTFTDDTPDEDWRAAVALLTRGEETDRRVMTREHFLVA